MIQTENKDFSQSKLKVIWFFLRPYKFHVATLFILSSIIGVLESASIAAIFPIVSLSLNIEAGRDNALLSLITTIAALLPIKDTFMSYCILFIFLVIMIFIIKLINVYFSAYVTTHLVLKNKERIFEKQMKADYQYFLDQKQGGLIYTTTTAPNGLMTLMKSITKLLSQIILMLFVLV